MKKEYKSPEKTYFATSSAGGTRTKQNFKKFVKVPKLLSKGKTDDKKISSSNPANNNASMFRNFKEEPNVDLDSQFQKFLKTMR